MGYAWAQWCLLCLNCLIILTTLFSLVANNKLIGSARLAAFIFYLVIAAAGFGLSYYAGCYTHIFGPVGPMVVAH
jgi:hypothetical protein